MNASIDPRLTALFSTIPDLDPQETAEWRDALMTVLAADGPERARFLLDELVRSARSSRIHWEPELSTPYVNSIPASEQPATDGLKDTVARVLPFWNESIAPAIRAGRRVLISAHGNSLRALIKHLDGVSDDDIVHLNIPTGQPLVYELDDDLRPIRHYYLGDAAEIEAAMAAVAAQGKAKKD